MVAARLARCWCEILAFRKVGRDRFAAARALGAPQPAGTRRDLAQVGTVWRVISVTSLLTLMGLGAPLGAQPAWAPLQQQPTTGGAGQPGLAQAYPQQPGAPWSFRPYPPTNARGVPPTTMPAAPATGAYPQPGQWQSAPQQYGAPAAVPGTYPGASGYSPYAQRPRTSASPTLEVELVDTEPYVQEPVLLRLDVISSGNLSTASPDVAGYDAVLLDEISGPKTSVRGSGRDREIVNSYTLALTPLRSGPLEVGPFEVSGTLAGGVPFSAVATAPTKLNVRPVIASVRPWLPLQALRLTRDLDDAGPLEEGRPITMTLRMEATGGTGEQLPDLEAMLTSEQFRAYREQTIIDTRLSDDKRRLQGIRTEVYTLVPYSGGRLQLPEVRVAWWNVDTARRESSSVPIRSLSVAGESGPFGFGRTHSAAGDESEGLAWVWIPIGGVLLLLIGYWAGVWYRVSLPAQRAAGAVKPGTTPPQRWMRNSLNALGRWVVAALRRLNPIPPVRWLAGRTRARLTAWTPASMRVYRCAIDAERAQSASEWALIFQGSSCQSLRTPSREPLPRVADRILRLRPGADGAKLRTLIQQLDVALYNGGDIDMAQWKRDLRTALRPGWGAFSGLLRQHVRRAHLPALNPRSSHA